MNIGETPSVQVPKEFLAVILAGVGDDLFPITGEYREEPCPKALLSIGNRPMLSYVLSWIEDSSIRDVLVVCPLSHRNSISNYVDSESSSLNIMVHSFDLDSSKGTCSTLRHITPQIAQYNCDIVLLPCDIIPPSLLKLENILNRFRVDRTTDGTILTNLFLEYRPPEKEKGASGDDAWAPPETPMPIAYDAKSNTLLHVSTLEDKDANDEEYEIGMGMLWKYPRVRLSRNLVDAHVYVCARSVLDLLSKKPRLHSFREEFIPWLCKVQYQRTKREKYSPVLTADTSAPTYSSALALQHSSTYLPTPPKSISKTSEMPESVTSGLTTQPSSPTPALDDVLLSEPSLRCGLVIHRALSGFAARAHNLWNFMELNRELNRVLLPTRPPPDRTLIDPSSSTADSLIGESTKIGERSSIKRSVIGKHCVIGKNVVITNSVLLDHCVIDDRAKLDGCILGNNTHVGEKSELVRCATQAGHEVEAGDSIKNRRLENSDWAAELSSDDSEDSELSGEDETDSDGSDEDDDDSS